MSERITFTARPYQEDDFAKSLEIFSEGHNLLYASAMGSGKSLMACWIAAYLCPTTFTHVVIVVPSRGIRQQFLSLSDNNVVWSGGSLTLPTITRKAAKSGKEALRQYLTDYNPTREFLVVTHNVFRAIWQNIRGLVENLGPGKVLLIADEGHHIPYAEQDESRDPLNDIGLATHECEALGVRVMKLTATAFRTDGTPIIGAGYETIERSTADLMIDGYAPQELLFDIITVPGGSISEGVGENAVIAMPADEKAGCEMVVNDWVKDGRPLGVVRIRCSTKKENDARVEMFRAAFAKHGAGWVLEAVGKHAKEYEELIRLIHSVTPPCYDELPDVLLCIRRADEGLDVPAISHVYFWGVPRSLGSIIQVTGRAMRGRVDANGNPKVKGFPANSKWLTASKVVFVMGPVDEVERKYRQFLIETCLFMSTYREVSLLGALARLRDNLYNGGKRQQHSKELKDILPAATTVALRDLQLELDQILEQTRTPYDSPLTVRDYEKLLVRLAEQKGIEALNQETIHRGLVAHWAATTPEGKEAVSRAFMEELSQGFPMDESVIRALSRITPEFSDLTFISGMLHKMSGEVISMMSARFREELSNLKKPGSLDDVFKGVDAYRQTHEGHFPAKSGRDPLHDHVRFADHDSMIKRGWNKIPPSSSSLWKLLVERESAGKTWIERILPIVQVMQMYQQAESPHIAMMGGPMQEMARTRYRNVPEMVYYPHAWRCLHLWPQIAAQLDLEEANRLGRCTLKEVEAFQQINGLDELVVAIKQGSFPAAGK